MNKKAILAALLTAAAWSEPKAEMCTRVVYTGPEKTILTGRTMDWKEDPQSKLWVFPRGMRRNGAAGSNSLEWTSKYGSVVDEAVEAFSGDRFDVVSDLMPDGTRMAALHLSISDAAGDSAILEYIDGKLAIHHSPAYTVMTNSPVFEQQLALDDYWNSIGGLVFLPGTNRAADRFVRASFYIGSIPKTDDTRLAVASVFSVIRNVSVPLGISTPDEPNISSTRWRTVADQKNRVYYYESVLYPYLIWVDFDGLDFSEGAPVGMIDPASGKRYAGNTSAEFIPTAPFVFQAAD